MSAQPVLATHRRDRRKMTEPPPRGNIAFICSPPVSPVPSIEMEQQLRRLGSLLRISRTDPDVRRLSSIFSTEAEAAAEPEPKPEPPLLCKIRNRPQQKTSSFVSSRFFLERDMPSLRVESEGNHRFGIPYRFALFHSASSSEEEFRLIVASHFRKNVSPWRKGQLQPSPLLTVDIDCDSRLSSPSGKHARLFELLLPRRPSSRRRLNSRSST